MTPYPRRRYPKDTSPLRGKPLRFNNRTYPYPDTQPYNVKIQQRISDIAANTLNVNRFQHTCKGVATDAKRNEMISRFGRGLPKGESPPNLRYIYTG